LLAILVGSGFLHALYRAVKVQWPDSYFTLDSKLGYAITSTPTRYVTFRFVPLFFVALFVAVTLDRLNGNPAAGALGVTLVHIVVSSGRASIGLLRAPFTSRRAPLLVLHGAVAGGSMLAGLGGFVLRKRLQAVVPAVEDLSASLWTGVFAGVAGVYIMHLSRHDGDNTYSSLRRSKEELGSRLWDLAGDAALRHGTDPALVRAMMLVENVQRPAWFRKLERVKGALFRRGTYGVMQVQSSTPLTDEQSIELCVSKHLNGLTVPLTRQGDYDFPDTDALKTIARGYNPDDGYVEGVVAAYDIARNETAWP
jgi:hypothetical protein